MEKTTMENSKMKKKKFKIPHPYVILFSMIIMVALLTYVIPAGQYAKIEVNGRMVVDPNSYTIVESNPSGFFDILKAFPKGLGDAQAIVFFVFIIGGAFNIINQTGSVVAGIGNITSKLNGKGQVMIPIIVSLFAFGGATIGMNEELIIFVPIGISLSRALGYDAIVGTAIVIMGAVAGFTSGFMNPFTVGIAQGIAELPLFSGIGLRIVVWLATITLVSVYISIYAKKVKNDPTKSFVYDLELEEKDKVLDLSSVKPLTKKQSMVLLVFGLGMLTMVFGVFKFGWYIVEIGAVFLAMGILSGIVYGMNLNELSEKFIDGAKDIAFGALIIGLARGVLVIMQDALILDSIVHGLANSISTLPKAGSAAAMLVVQSFLNFIIPSGSGLAATTMPIMAPLADVIGITRQTAVLAFQFGDGITNYIVPTNGVLMACLAIANIKYDKWVKFIWPLIALWTIMGVIFVIYAALTNYGPF